MLRTLRRIALIALAVVAGGFVALLVLARVYDAEVKAKLVGTLNGYLTAPVTVTDMELTLIDRFPQASIHMKGVVARDALTKTDTLLYAEDLYLEFSLLGMLRGVYRVDEVHGERVIAHPGVDSTGRENWIVWKSDSTAGGTDFSLDRVSLEHLRVRYRDARSGLEIAASSDASSLGGSFRAEGSEVKLRGDLHLHHWMNSGGTVLADRSAHLDLRMAFGGPDGGFRITKGEVLSGDVPLSVTLAFVPAPGGDRIDLRASGLGLDLATAVDLLPEALHKRFARYRSTGEVDLALTYAGALESGPLFSMGMNVRDGSMVEQRSGARFTAINGECAIDLDARGDLSRLLVKGFTAKAASGTIAGSWDMKGTKASPLKAEVKVDMALADLLRFAQVDTLETAEGRLVAHARVNGKLRDVVDLRAADLKGLVITGTARLKNATLKMKGIRHAVSDLDAELTLAGNDARVNALHCAVQGNALDLTGELRNLMPYLLFNDQPLGIVASATSPRIDLATLLSDDAAAASAKDYTLTLPSLVRMELKARVDELAFERFRATDITGTVELNDRVLRASPVMFNTASGGVLGSMHLDARTAGSYALSIDADVKDMDVHQLFDEFQEFGQGFITSNHLSGTADARVALRSPLSPALRLDLDRLHCTVDIAIADGGIKGHRPLMDVAGYVAKNKAIAPFVDVEGLRERLANVTFDRLENRIEIRDQQVIVPAMVVHNNVMDIELSGTHGFDDRIDHHLNFRLGDLLKKGSSNDEFGPVADDGTGLRIFLHMYGLATAPQFETDGAMAAQRRREGIRQETAELRSILHNELNPFKKRDPESTAAAATDPVRISVEDEGDTSKLADKPKRRGLGALFEQKREEKEVISVED